MTTDITAYLGSSLTIALIFFNYRKKINTDIFQRKLLIAMLYATIFAVITDFTRNFLIGFPDEKIKILFYINTSLLMITENCANYIGVVFIDYFSYRNTDRSRKLKNALIIFLILHAVGVIVFMIYNYTASMDYEQVKNNVYTFRIYLGYGSILLTLFDVMLSFKYFRHSKAYMVILFLLIKTAGPVLDFFIEGSSLVWPCFSGAVLFLYFFIIQSDSKIDSLTKTGNRASFNEFIDKLSRHNATVKYSIVMIDMDKFKDINDTLGHFEGDNALRDIATIIRDNIRHSDFAARYGGDEFVIVTEEENEIQPLMERIQSAIDVQNNKHIRPYQLYISYGYDVYTTNSGQSIYKFLAKVDALMYKQKASRKRKGLPSAITREIIANENKGENNV